MACVAGVPDEVRFATKVALGRRMLHRALEAKVPASWVTADEFYGADRGLRRDLQARELGYVLAVAKSHRLTLSIGTIRADRSFNRISAGPGSKGERDYDWACVRVSAPEGESPTSTTCSSAAASPTVNWPSTAAGHLNRCR